MRLIVHGSALILATVTTACFGYGRVSTTPAPGANVRIVLTSATAVTTTDSAGGRQEHAAVLEASGTVQAAAADTVAVKLGELRTATGALAGVAGRIALVPTGRISHMEQRRFRAGRTALAGVGLATIALGVFLLVIIGAITGSS